VGQGSSSPAAISLTPCLPPTRHQATQWAIDELKATVPIWKKEFFEDGSVWKENAESRQLHQQQQQSEQQQPSQKPDS
jgi:molybdopterin synthase catalytic subunit